MRCLLRAGIKGPSGSVSLSCVSHRVAFCQHLLDFMSRQQARWFVARITLSASSRCRLKYFSGPLLLLQTIFSGFINIVPAVIFFFIAYVGWWKVTEHSQYDLLSSRCT